MLLYSKQFLLGRIPFGKKYIMVSAVITRDRLFVQFLLYHHYDHHLPLQFAFFIKGLLKTVGFFFDTYLASYSQTDRQHLSIFTSNSSFVCFFSNIFKIILILNFLNFTLYLFVVNFKNCAYPRRARV